eukprot:1336722-Amorphochlora_amoeboformis.AAC.1
MISAQSLKAIWGHGSLSLGSGEAAGSKEDRAPDTSLAPTHTCDKQLTLSLTQPQKSLNPPNIPATILEEMTLLFNKHQLPMLGICKRPGTRLGLKPTRATAATTKFATHPARTLPLHVSERR